MCGGGWGDRDSSNLNFENQKWGVRWNGTTGGSDAKWAKLSLDLFWGCLEALRTYPFGTWDPKGCGQGQSDVFIIALREWKPT